MKKRIRKKKVKKLHFKFQREKALEIAGAIIELTKLYFSGTPQYIIEIMKVSVIAQINAKYRAIFLEIARRNNV